MVASYVTQNPQTTLPVLNTTANLQVNTTHEANNSVTLLENELGAGTVPHGALRSSSCYFKL